MKQRIFKAIKKVLIASGVLLVLLIVAGLIYTWFSGRNVSQDAIATEASPTPTLQHVKQAENAPVGVSLQLLSTPIKPGAEASMSIRTNPDAVCSLSVIYDKTPSADPGLIAKTADEYGMVEWKWTIDKNAAVGKWPAKVTCERNGKSGMFIGDLVVAK